MVENQFRRDARVGTGDDSGNGVLFLDQLDQALLAGRLIELVSDESAVAVLETLEGVRRRDDGFLLRRHGRIT